MAATRKKKNIGLTWSSFSSAGLGAPLMNLLVVLCVLLVWSIIKPSPHDVLRASLNISTKSKMWILK